MRYFFKLSIFLLLLNSCKHSNKNHSQSQFALSDPKYGSIYKMVLINETTINHNAKELKVCIGQGDSHITNKQLMLESQLAMVAWLEAGGIGNENNWKLFKFTQQDHCSKNLDNFHIAIHISKDENGYFSANSTISGLGGSAALSIGQNSINFTSAAEVTLNPYKEWESIEKSLGYLPFFSDKSKVEGIKNLYHFLLGLENPSYSDLQNFVNFLSQQKYLPKPKHKVNGGSQPLPLYHVLLHEVGHTFGLQHADDPEHEEIVGSAMNDSIVKMGASTTNAYKTKESVMAYSDNYFFLTADDLAGAKKAVQLTRENLK